MYLGPERPMRRNGVGGTGLWEGQRGDGNAKGVTCTRHTHAHTRMGDGTWGGQGKGEKGEGPLLKSK